MNKPDKRNKKQVKKTTLRDNSQEFTCYLFHVLQHSGTLGLEIWSPKDEKDAPQYMYSKS